MTLSGAFEAASVPVVALADSAEAGTIPWLWIAIAAVVIIAGVIGFIVYRAGGELKVPIRLIVTAGSMTGREIPITAAFVTIGSEKDNDIVIDDDKVSKHHARLRYKNATLTISDTNSLYGTFVNGERVETANCQDGDLIRLGTVFEYRVAMSK